MVVSTRGRTSRLSASRRGPSRSWRLRAARPNGRIDGQDRCRADFGSERGGRKAVAVADQGPPRKVMTYSLLPTPYSLIPVGQWPPQERDSMIYKAIVFLPAIGALIAGPARARARARGPARSSPPRSWAAGAVLSWIAFWQVGFGGETLRVPVAALGDLGRARRVLGAAHRHADRRDAGGGQHRLGAGAPLLHRLHARGRQPPALLRLSLACSPSPCWRW